MIENRNSATNRLMNLNRWRLKLDPKKPRRNSPWQVLM